MTTAALIGSGISASLTPALHEQEGAAHGLNYTYERYDMSTPRFAQASLADVLALAQQSGLVGVNVTYPFKQSVLEYLDEVSPEARDIGAVNTVVFEGGKWIGHNTDYRGFRAAFVREINRFPLADVALVGAGGAGAAVGLALVDQGVGALHIFDKDSDAALGLTATLSRLRPAAQIAVWDGKAPVDGLVNATPMGMATHPGMAVSLEDVLVRSWVGDIVYFPLTTALLRDARGRGLHTMTGGGMAVGQAAASFDLFTGRTADVARMTGHFQTLTKDIAA